MGLECLSYKERLRELELFSLEKSHQCIHYVCANIHTYIIYIYIYNIYIYMLCSVVPSTRTRGDGHKLAHRKLPLNIRKQFRAVQMTEHWHRLLRGCGVSSLQISRNCLDMVLSTLHLVSLLEEGLGQMDPEVPASFKHSMKISQHLLQIRNVFHRK